MKQMSSGEFEKYVSNDAYAKGLNQRKRNLLASMFLGDKDEGKITQKEAEKTFKHIEKNKYKLKLSDKDIEKYREIFDKRLH